MTTILKRRSPASAGCVAAVLMSLAAGSCEHRTHKEIRTEAEQGWNTLRSDMRVRLAKQQLESGRVDEAIETLTEAVGVYPDSAEVFRLLARGYIERGDLGSAREAIASAGKIGDDTAEFHYIHGSLLELQGQYEDALDAFIKSAAIAPQCADYLTAAAEMYVRTDQPERARLLLCGDIGNARHEPKLLLMRAAVFELLGEYAPATEDYRQLLQLLDSPPWLVQQYARALMQQHRFSEALAVVSPHLDAVAPEHVFTRRGRATESEQDGQSALTLRRLAAECYLSLDRSREARKILREYSKNSPDDARAWWLLAEAAAKLNDLNEVRSCARHGRKADVSLPHWDVLDAYVHWKQGRRTRAEQLLRRLIDVHPSHAPAHVLLGKLYQEGNDDARANEHFQMAARLSVARSDPATFAGPRRD